ncbi:monocarboxylate transporter 3-like [Diadema antillarum]|uniref:monocarboxylate transporter 3-like n=1 Tax=Diadema antillarum TaxID=105358 RepID=UPI003A8AE657
MATNNAGTNRFGRDSRHRWRYVVILSKFTLLFLDAGLAKSFGVLLPEMVARFNSDHRTMGFICSLPSSLMFLLAPAVMVLLRVIQRRVLAVLGGLLCGVSLLLVPLVDEVYLLAALLIVTGLGLALTCYPAFVALQEHCPETFVVYNAVSQYGTTLGAVCMPVIIERSMEAYGYGGAFTILGAICLNAIVCGATLRPPMDYNSITGEPSPSEDSNNLEWHSHSEEETVDSSSSAVSDTQSSNGRTKHSSLLTRLQLVVSNAEPLFIFVSPALFLCCYVLYAWMLLLVPHATELGIDISNAVFLSSIAGFGGIFGRLAFLILLRFDCNFILFMSCCLLGAVSFFVNSLTDAYAFQALLAFIQGLVIFILDASVITTMNMTVRNEANIPTALAVSSFLIGAGAIAGDTSSGRLYDVTNSFSIVFISLGFILIFAFINFLATYIIHRRLSQ